MVAGLGLSARFVWDAMFKLPSSGKKRSGGKPAGTSSVIAPANSVKILVL